MRRLLLLLESVVLDWENEPTLDVLGINDCGVFIAVEKRSELTILRSTAELSLMLVPSSLHRWSLWC